MSGALEYSQYRIDDIVERIEKEIEQATCERPPLVTERGVCVKHKFGKGHYSVPLWSLGFRTFESAETYFKERGYKEQERTEQNGERKLVMYDPILDETYEITTYTREHYPPDEDGNEPFYPDYTEETLKELRRGIVAIKRANAYLRCIDGLIDYDCSEDPFHKRLKTELLKLRIEEEEIHYYNNQHYEREQQNNRNHSDLQRQGIVEGVFEDRDRCDRREALHPEG